MWTLEDAILLIRDIEPIANQAGFTVALYGGVLIRGTGNDLDLFFVEQDSDICSVEECLQGVVALPEILRYGAPNDLRNEICYTIWLKDGRHIDAHFRAFSRPTK
jgi:hypothetical protein